MNMFEDLPVWRAGRELVKQVYGITRSRPASGDPGFCDQIQRAVISVTSNVAEGHERGSTQDLIQFLFYAKGSVGEARSQLYHAEDLGYATPEQAEKLRAACRDISRQLSAWMQSMQKMSFKGGPKFHKEPETTWATHAAKAGLERQPDGSYRQVREGRVGYGKRKTGRRKKD